MKQRTVGPLIVGDLHKNPGPVRALKNAVRAKGELLDALLALGEEVGLESTGGCDPADIDDLDWHLSELAIFHSSPEEIEEIGIDEVRWLLETAEQQRCMVHQAQHIARLAQRGVPTAGKAAAIIRGQHSDAGIYSIQ